MVEPGALPTQRAGAYFVNREAELDLLWQLAHGQSDWPLLWITAPSGMGKSALLAELRTRCLANQIRCAQIDFARWAYRSNPNYLAVVLDLWQQWNLGQFEELRYLIASTRSFTPLNSSLQTTDEIGASNDPVGQGVNGSAAPPEAAPVVGDTITGTVSLVGPYSQVAIGKQIVQTLFVQGEDTPELQQLLRSRVTALFCERLAYRTASDQMVLLLDSWEEVIGHDGWLKEAGAWLHDELLVPLSKALLPALRAVLSSTDELGVSALVPYLQRLSLGELAPTAVQEYFIRRGVVDLSPTEVQVLVEITGGVPLAMQLMATGIVQQRSRELLMSSQTNALQAQTLIQNAVEHFLANLSQPEAQAVRLAAIPHWVNHTLLARLIPDEVDWEKIFTLPFIQQDEERADYCYHPEVRNYLLGWWRTHEPSEFLAVNQQVLAQFQAHHTATRNPQQPTYADEQEVLYHLLITDEAAGLDYLTPRFEQACERYALGVAQGYVNQLVELHAQGSLTNTAQRWLQYFSAHLDLIHRRGDRGEAVFQSLIDYAPDPILEAMAQAGLGRLRAGQQQWSEAIRLYRISLRVLVRRNATRSAARVRLHLGDAYNDMARYSGADVHAEEGEFGRRSRLLHLLQHFPFLVYEALVRRVRFLPNWYFGTNYQEWIVAYLRTEAAHWYRLAEQDLLTSGETSGLLRVRLCLADLEHRLGHWARARYQYGKLAAFVAQEDDPMGYGAAQVKLGLGRTLWRERRLADAEVELQEALTAFRHFEDHQALGESAILLGATLAALGRREEALSAYATGVTAFTRSKDGPACTQAVWALEDLLAGAPPSEAISSQVRQALAGVTERYYLTRFPNTFLRWFRRLALLGALPVSYLVTMGLAFTLIIVLAFWEGEAGLWRSGEGAADLVRSLTLSAITVMPIFLSLWLYRLVYSLLGLVVVQWFGRRLVVIEEDQPSQIITNPTGLTYRDGRTGATLGVAWSEVAALVPIDYQQWHRPITLISGTLLKTVSQTTMVLEAVTTGYEHLKRDIQRQVAASGTLVLQQSRAVALINGRWLLTLLVVASAFALYVHFFSSLQISFVTLDKPVGQGPGVTIGTGLPAVSPGSTQAVTGIASFLFSLVPLFLLLFPSLTLWRLAYHRLRLHRELGYQWRTIPPWLLWLATALCTLVAMLGLALVFMV
jgi:tetratricopeptide (TPR) repeat protein